MQFLFICVLVSLSTTLAAVPNWKKCPASDSDNNECLKEAIQGAIKDLVHGSKIGFESLEDFRYKGSVQIINSNSGPFRGKLIYSDLQVEGFGDGRVNRVEKEGGDLLRVEFFFPMTKITGKYLMDTVLLAVPMKGKGDFELLSKNVTIVFDFRIKSKTVDGVEYYNAETVKQSDYKLDYLQIHHSNLFGGNKALSDNVNKLLNEQWRTLAKELGPITINAFSPIYKQISNSVLNKIPVSQYPI